MKNFPIQIDIRNKTIVMQPYKSNFEEFNYERIIQLLRKEIYIHLVSRKDENDYFIKISNLINDDDLYNKCLKNQQNIVKIVLNF